MDASFQACSSASRHGGFFYCILHPPVPTSRGCHCIQVPGDREERDSVTAPPKRLSHPSRRLGSHFTPFRDSVTAKYRGSTRAAEMGRTGQAGQHRQKGCPALRSAWGAILRHFWTAGQQNTGIRRELYSYPNVYALKSQQDSIAKLFYRGLACITLTTYIPDTYSLTSHVSE